MTFKYIRAYRSKLFGIFSNHCVLSIIILGVFEDQHYIVEEFIAIHQILHNSLLDDIKTDWLSDSSQVLLLVLWCPRFPDFLLIVPVLVLVHHLLDDRIDILEALLLSALRAVIMVLSLHAICALLQH